MRREGGGDIDMWCICDVWEVEIGEQDDNSYVCVIYVHLIMYKVSNIHYDI